MAKAIESQVIGLNRRHFMISAVTVAGGVAGAAHAEPARAAPATAGATYRVGVLGTGSVARQAMLEPAAAVPELRIDAVSSRDAKRGRAYADAHHIPRSMDYEELIQDPGIDIVYITLPPSLHAEWSIRALQAGKHVLCEKPMSSNAREAAEVAAAARRSGRVFMEAFHFPYHPFSKRVRDMLDTNAIGRLQSVDVVFEIPQRVVASTQNIRRQFALGGGVLMDAGCYGVLALRNLLGGFERVVQAHADTDPHDPQVDMAMQATLEFGGGRRGHLHASFLAHDKAAMSVTAHGETGTLAIQSPFVPQWGAALLMQWPQHTYSEAADRTPDYIFQLRELVRSIHDGAPVLTSADNGIANMSAIDAIYTKAGLKPRGT
jgi:predicted dehydrogenase